MELTKRQRYVLEQMMTGEELVRAVPGGWWLDTEQIGGAVGWKLLRYCLISATSMPDDMERYSINEEGRKVLADPAYVPLMEAELKRRGLD